jgi:hypothetical protein
MKRATDEEAEGEASEDSPVKARGRAAVILHGQKDASITLSNTVLRGLLRDPSDRKAQQSQQ